MSPEQARPKAELTVDDVLRDLGESRISFTMENGETKSGTVREAYEQCEFLRNFDGNTLQVILGEVVAASTPDADEQ